MTESQAVSKLIKSLNKHGYFWKSSDRFRAGIPDIVGCVRGIFTSFEVKVDYNTTSAIQKHTIKEIRKHGGQADVVTYSNRRKKWFYIGKDHTFAEVIVRMLDL